MKSDIKEIAKESAGKDKKTKALKKVLKKVEEVK